jgi:signal peptide peptidase SppA
MMNVLDLLHSPWAIQPEILTEMCSVYAAHRDGRTVDTKAAEAALGRPFRSEPKPYSVQHGVALVPIEGILSKRMSLLQQICGGQTYQAMQRDLAIALADPDVAAIILTIDSPGGSVDGVQGAADAIYEARTRKPIVAFVDGTAASAAYWLGSSASRVYIGSDTDQVGSIGIVTQHIDTSNAEHQRGVKITDIAAGRYKAVGSQHAPLSSQDRNTIQDQLDQVYGIFVDTVVRNRGVSVNKVLNQMADGRVFIGQRAIDAGLVDGKTTLPALIQKMSQQSARAATKGKSLPRPAQPTEPAPPVGIPQSAAAAATAIPISPIYPQIQRLRILKAEEAELRAQIATAQEKQTDATTNLWFGQQMHRGWKELVPLVEQKTQATETIRSLRIRLAANDRAQLAVLNN